jgi:hypothetical protein
VQVILVDHPVQIASLRSSTTINVIAAIPCASMPANR